jgi:hypothetical protein
VPDVLYFPAMRLSVVSGRRIDAWLGGTLESIARVFEPTPQGFTAAHRGGGSTPSLSYTDLRGSGSQLREPAKVNGPPFLKCWSGIVLVLGVSLDC